MWLLRNLIVAAMAGDPARRDELIAGAIRYGRHAAQPPTEGEYAAALAFLFRHNPSQGTPWPALPGPSWPEPVVQGTSWLEAMDTPSGPPPGPDRESFPPGWREPPTGPQRNLGTYADGKAEDGGGAP
jgi:hypothetical protein